MLSYVVVTAMTQQQEQARMLEFVGRVLFGAFVALMLLAGALFQVQR
jgi:hypothetical protein